MARFLVDESLPRAVTRALLAAGYDALDARDVGLRGRPDSLVHDRAKADERLLIAGDLDFADALRFPPETHPGIVVLRVPESWNSGLRAERIVAGIAEAGLEAISGAITIIEPARTRIFKPRPNDTSA